MASAALSIRFTTTRLNCSGSIDTGGRSGRQIHADLDAFQPTGENAEAACHHVVQFARDGLRRRQTGELRELVDQAFHRSRFLENGLRALAHHVVPSPAAAAVRCRFIWRRMRSADSVIGVSGFLISCATRRATSLQAAVFCARSRSLVSSMTITNPDPRRPSMAETVTARCSVLRGSLHLQLLGGVARAAGAIHQVADFGRILARKQIFEPNGACAASNREKSPPAPCSRAEWRRSNPPR